MKAGKKAHHHTVTALAMEIFEDLASDALLAEALDAYELTANPFMPTCVISSGFCATGPTFSSTGTSAPLLVSSSASSSTTPNPPASSTLFSGTRYAPPKTDQEVIDARQRAVPKKTQEDTKYCYKLFYEWSIARQKATGETIGKLCEMSDSEIQHWMTRFILEVRKKDGKEYSPNTLHHVTAGIMRHLRCNGRPDVDFFRDIRFSEFRQSLDSEMKRLLSLGIKTKKKQAEVLTEEEEELLWTKGLLGGDTPQSLLDTVVFYNGIYFALRSGREHRQLRNFPCQIDVVEKPGERPYLLYHEDTSKNHQGGLKGRKIMPKVVEHHSNIDNPDRCFVTLFKKYRRLCPDDPIDNGFYLQPSRSPTDTCWYTKQPIGKTKLGDTVPRLCTQAGIEGHKTNHSLRATAATRLYQSGVDEQQIMERTGHRSLEGVRSYKRTSRQQREALSDILNRSTNPQATSSTSITHPPPAVVKKDSTSCAFTSQQQLRSLSLTGASFQDCTVNFYVGSTTTKRRRPMVITDDSDSD